MHNKIEQMNCLSNFILILLGLSWTPALAQVGPLLIQQGHLERIKTQLPELEQDLSTLAARVAHETPIKKLLSQNPKVKELIGNVQEFWKPEFPKDFLFKDVSATCVSHTRSLVGQQVTQTWALQMLDAWGKPPSGLLSGHTQMPGDFRECIQIRGEYPLGRTEEDKEIRGRYCTSYVGPGPALVDLLLPPEESETESSNATWVFGRAALMQSVSVVEFLEHLFGVGGIVNMFPMIGTCFPASCSQADVHQLLANFHTNVAMNFTASAIGACYTDEKPEFKAGQYVIMVLLAAIACLCGAATILDVYMGSIKRDSVGTTLLLAFSLYTNTQKFLSTRAGGDDLGCLHGLRVLSMAWVVLGHTFFMGALQLTWNLIDIKTLYKDWSSYPLLNASVSVDTFFVMSGALVAYNLLRELDKTKGRLNYPLMVLHRYMRLTPTYMILIGIMSTLLPYLGSGPMWLIIEHASEACAKNWWHNMLYINNLVKYGTESEVCYGEAWYLANDVQFFILSPIVIYPLWRWKLVGFSLLAALSIASVVIPAWIIEAGNLAPTAIIFIDFMPYNNQIYIKPWTRFGPYVIGIFLGYILYLRKKSPSKFRNFPTVFVVLGWCLSTAGALGVIYGPMRYFDPANAETTYDSWHATMYAGLHRYVWGLVIAWIVFACVSGYGGIVNSFLSLKMFVPLGRLTFCMYITSYNIQMIYHLGIIHPSEFSKFHFTYIYFAHLFVSGMVAYILTLTLESPFIQLEKIAFSSRASPSPKQSNDRASKNGAAGNANENNEVKVQIIA